MYKQKWFVLRKLWLRIILETGKLKVEFGVFDHIASGFHIEFLKHVPQSREWRMKAEE